MASGWATLRPGNLYYHFQDKQDIIRALHAECTAAREGRWALSSDVGENLATLGENLAAGMDLTWDYRFFEREVLALLRADERLRSSYREAYRQRLGEWVAFGEHLVAQGVLRSPAAPQTVGDLAVAIWLIAEGWLPFLDAIGDPVDPPQRAKGADLILVALAPFLTARGRRLLATREAPIAGGTAPRRAAATGQVRSPERRRS